MSLLAFVLSFSLVLSTQTAPATAISKICFSRGEFIYLKDLQTGVLKRVVKGSYPSLSPNGKTLAYSVDNMMGTQPAKENTREIKLIDLETNKITSFDSLKNFLCYQATWSPDGSKLAFGLFKGNRWDLAVMDATTREWRLLTDKLSGGASGYSFNSWTADSQAIVGQDLDNIYEIDLSGKVLKHFPMTGVVDDISYVSSLTKFSLSADARTLLFDTEEQPDDPRLPMIWLYDLETKSRVRVTPKNVAGYDPKWLSPTEIIFTGWPSGPRGRKPVPGIYRIHKDGTGLELLVANGESATFALSH
jgi:dipeptidyl aminopeptidase/acylaminoacyl peptidase